MHCSNGPLLQRPREDRRHSRAQSPNIQVSEPSVAVGYDTLKDFEEVALVADLPLLLVTTPSLPTKARPWWVWCSKE
jgi:hypothetical protein